MSAAVFISYRRGGASWAAGRVYDHFAEQIGESTIFMDVDDIALGQNFIEVLRSSLSECVALIVIIDPSWLSATNEHGQLRLQDPADFVRMEVEYAIARKIPLFPVLVDGASMPSAAQLPDSIATLSQWQAIEIASKRFRSDVRRLLNAVKKITRNESTERTLPRDRSGFQALASGRGRAYVSLEGEEVLIPLPNLPRLPPGELRNSRGLNTMRVATLGAAASGKTTYMMSVNAVAAKSEDSDFYLYPTRPTISVRLAEKWNALTREGNWPEPTDELYVYNFKVNRGLDAFCEIEWIDYAGGALAERSGESRLEALLSYLRSASSIHVLLDGHSFRSTSDKIRLMRALHVHPIQAIFQRVYQDRISAGQALPSIAIILSKSDLIEPSKLEEILLLIIPELFPLLLLKELTTLVVPIAVLDPSSGTVGSNSASSLVNVLLPLDFAFRQFRRE